jgi:hypothetical protein
MSNINYSNMLNWGAPQSLQNQFASPVVAPAPIAQPIPDDYLNSFDDFSMRDTMGNAPINAGATPQGPASWSWLGGKNADGSQINSGLGAAFGAAQGMFNGYLGMKQLAVAKQTLAEGRRQFDLNYGNQRQMVNTQLEDRQRARVASNPTGYQSVGDYMSKNRIA